MNFITLSSKISAKKAAIEFLQEKGILHNAFDCILSDIVSFFPPS